MLTYEFTTSPIFVSVIEDDHLLNATYYSPDIEEPLDSTAMLGNIVHSESPTPFQAGGGGGGGGTTFNGGSLHHSHSHQHGGSQSHIDTAASVGKSKSIKNHLHISMKRQQQYCRNRYYSVHYKMAHQTLNVYRKTWFHLIHNNQVSIEACRMCVGTFATPSLKGYQSETCTAASWGKHLPIFETV